MIKLLGIELKKFLRLKTLIVILLFFILCGKLVYNAYCHIQHASKNLNDIYLEDLIAERERSIKNLLDILEMYKKKGNNTVVQSTEESIKKHKETLDLLYAKRTSAKDKLSRMDYSIKELELQLKNKALDTVNYRNIQEMEKQLEIYKAYKASGIIPDDDRFTALRYIREFPTNMCILYMAIFILLLVGDAVSSEHSSGTLRVYLSQPVKRGRVLLAKYLAAIIVSIVLFLFIELFYFVILGLLYGWGPLNAPMELGASYIKNSSSLVYIKGTQYFVPGYIFMIYSLLLQCLYIAAVASLGFLISVIFKKPAVSLSFNVCLLLMIYTIIYNIKAFKAVHSFLFSSYGDITGLLTGNLRPDMRNNALTIPTAIITMGVTCVVCYLLSHFIFKKQQIY